MESSYTLIVRALSFYRDHFSAIFGIVVVPAIFAVSSELAVGASTLMHSLFVLLYIIFSFLASIALIQFVSRSGGSAGDIGKTYLGTLPFVLPILWISIITSLSVLGGTILFIIPGIIVMLYTFFSQYVLIVEGKRGVMAVATSWTYVRGHAWEVFLRLFVFLSGVLILIFVLAAPLYLITGEHVIPDETLNSQFSVTRLFFNLIEILFLTPVGIAYFYFVYSSLKLPEPVPPDQGIRTKIVWLSVFAIIATIIITVLIGVYFDEIAKFLELKLETGPNLDSTAGTASQFPFLK